MSKVFVLTTNKQPLDPVHPGWARKLLSSGKAAVFRHSPFTIILKVHVSAPHVHPLRLKLDPGSTTTGLAIVNDASGEVVFAAELHHRGEAIKAALDRRRALRRARRQRKTRYRPPRFANRRKKKGWLPPSLESRLANILTWVERLMRYAPITALSQELVKFDLQQMENPHISGVEYQQGSLSGYEVREYLLEQWNRQCAYCGAKDVPLQIEHIVPRAKGGTSRISNLTLACEPCNLKKGTQNIREFLTDKPDVLKRLLATASAPLKDATAVNTTRWALHKRLKALGLPVECGSGGRTKYNRAKRALPKTHWCDAACLGASTPEQLISKGVIPLLIRATGHGTRQMCGLDKYGFPIRHRQRQKSSYGYKTGDLVKAIIPKGKYAGTHIGRVTIRSRPSFGLNGFDVHPKYLKVLQQQDGYSYQSANMAIPPSPFCGEGGMANGCGERRASAEQGSQGLAGNFHIHLAGRAREAERGDTQAMYSAVEHDPTNHPLVRVITLGEFALERLVPTPGRAQGEPPQYVLVPRSEWSNRGPAMALLKVLLCRANRRASRDELIEAIWPDHEAIKASHALDSAASVLRRHILRTGEMGSLLLTLRSGGETIFKLAGQQRLWVDADALLSLASQALRAECRGQNPIPLLEEAYALASGEFLEDDMYCEWTQSRRRTINGARHRVLFKLVDLYLNDEQMGLAEELLFAALEEDPADEDALCRLMILLVEQERRQEALQLYQYTEDVLQEEQAEPAVYTRELARRIRQGLVLREQRDHYAAVGAQTPAPLGQDMQSEWRKGPGGSFCVKRVRLMIVVASRRGQISSSYRYRPPRRHSRGQSSKASASLSPVRGRVPDRQK